MAESLHPTIDQQRQHLIDGIGDTCLICDSQFCVEWTDYNGQVKCSRCGMTYQFLGSHHTAEYLAKIGLDKSKVAKRYCDEFEIVSLCREYWSTTGNKIPLGLYFGRNPVPDSESDAFWDWMKANADRFESQFADEFNWDSIKERT